MNESYSSLVPLRMTLQTFSQRLAHLAYCQDTLYNLGRCRFALRGEANDR